MTANKAGKKAAIRKKIYDHLLSVIRQGFNVLTCEEEKLSELSDCERPRWEEKSIQLANSLTSTVVDLVIQATMR